MALVESQPDNPNRIRWLALEVKRRQVLDEKEALLERVEALNGELKKLDEEYAGLPFTPPAAADVEFRRGNHGRISISERIFRMIQDGGPNGATYDDIRARLNLTRPQLYTYVIRLEKRGLVRRDMVGGEHVVLLTVPDLPYEQSSMRLRMRME